ncbi:uncharacterized protein LOC142573838 [Dermacentor variabilis]|uniref:uncharacterized protein LOC142573838 n=1 Tax=Dermacentor variabilis TaxID=34621 RepID=UPI003F5C9FC4
MTREDGKNDDTDALMDDDEAVETFQPLQLSLASGPIQEVEEIRILGLFINQHLKAGTTLAKLLKVGDQVNRVHRFSATYIWESQFERIRRSNLFLSKAKRGLGLVNVEVKLKVHRYLFFKNQTQHIIRFFFFRLHVEVLPVKTWLHDKGFFVPWSTDCPLCPYPESLQHVFLFCVNAVLFWQNIRIVFDVQIYQIGIT